LQYSQLDVSKLEFAVERNLKKVGRMTSTGIPIISEDMMRQNPPEFLLVLPWHFKAEIIERESEFLRNGGQLIFPFPNFEIISMKPKMLITGSRGMIAQYVIREVEKDHCLYGLTHSETSKDNQKRHIHEICCDTNDYDRLDFILSLIKPNSIVHLASISS